MVLWKIQANCRAQWPVVAADAERPQGAIYRQLRLEGCSPAVRATRGNLEPDTRAGTLLRSWTADEAYWPKMSFFRFWYSSVSSVTRGPSTSRMKACLVSPARGRSNWVLAA